MGFLDDLLGRARLTLDRTPDGPRVTETRTGLSFVAPDDGQLVDGFPESPVSPAFDGGFRLASCPVEVRVRVEDPRVNPRIPPAPEGTPPPPPPAASPELAHDLCLHRALSRTEADPQVGVAQRWQLDEWRVDGAASTIYPLARPEGRFDFEECHVLVKGSPARAVVLTKLFSTGQLSPALWSDLNGRLNATLAWGGPARRPVPRTESFYVDASMALTEGARAEVARVAGQLRSAGVAAAGVASAAGEVLRFAYGSDSPDAELDREVRELLGPALLEPIEASDLRALVEGELSRRVKTYRDFRGLHVFLEAVAGALGFVPPPKEGAAP